jgi:hypothetical protein
MYCKDKKCQVRHDLLGGRHSFEHNFKHVPCAVTYIVPNLLQMLNDQLEAPNLFERRRL